MIYSPFIEWISKEVPLTLLVKPADEQKVEGEVACFCPFCKGERAHGDTPHFIIYEDRFGGNYGGKGAQMWKCTRTRRQGYGALELYAAIHGYTLEGESLRKCCLDLLEQCGYVELDVRKRFPAEHPYVRDLRGEAERPSEQFMYQCRADLTPQELTAIGCEVRMEGDKPVYSFGEGFTTEALNNEFRTYSLAKVTLPAVRGRSEEIYGTPFNPLFITFADQAETCGCVWRPATDTYPIVFSLNADITVARVSKWLAGDAVFCYATDHRDTGNTAVMQAINALQPEEQFTDTRKEWVNRINREGDEEPNKFDCIDVEIPVAEIKARNIVYCDTPQDAIATYYTLKARRESQPMNEQLQKECWYHVAFLFGKGKFFYLEHGEWKQSKVEFSTVQHNKLTRFAEKVTILFPNTRKSQRTARAIACRFRDMSLALLPVTFESPLHRKAQWLFGHTPQTVRDFILAYKMLDEEAFRYDRDFRKFFHGILKTALTSCPLIEQQKRDRNNAVKETYYTVDSATIWMFMMCEGYFRAVDPSSNDKIGEYVHRDGPFIEPLTKESMVAKTLEALREYASVNSKSQEDYHLMLQGIARAGKEVNLQTIVSLPATVLNYEGAYGPDHDHFFYLNGALRITPQEVRFISYDEVAFDIDRRAVRPFNFRMPQSLPFTISENPEAADREREIQAKKDERDRNGNPVYNTRQISQMDADYMEWSRTYRWIVDWQGRTEQEMWPSLRVLRGFANVGWEMEEQAVRSNEKISDLDTAILNTRFANFIFACGVSCWRYHGGTTNCGLYLMENSVADNRKASGGSGKSTLANIFMSAARKVLSVDCKKMVTPQDMRFALSDYTPNVDTIIHWEDLPKSFSLKLVYNFITSGFQYERKHEAAQSIKLADSPAHVVSSNYPMSDSDDSTLGRFVMVPFSDRFCRENPLQNKPARKISTMMKDFSGLGIEYFRNSSQCQMAYIMALAVQFVMRNQVIVNAPIADVKHRQMVEQLTDAFVRWAEYYFSRPQVYGHIVCLKSCWDEYKRDFTDSSKARQDQFALSTFKDKVREYCQFNGIFCNPEHLLSTERQRRMKKFEVTAWVTVEYFPEKEWGNDYTVSTKYIRERKQTAHGYVFYRQTDNIPPDYDTLKEQQTEYMSAADPMPILDPDGAPVMLTDYEKVLSGLGPRHTAAQLDNALAAKGISRPDEPVQPQNEEDMPF